MKTGLTGSRELDKLMLSSKAVEKALAEAQTEYARTSAVPVDERKRVAFARGFMAALELVAEVI